ncbi:MAG: tRNA 2-selenouridine(34) synthase MnmH [Bacteroidia bacterium]|nr:tRNA 2-selenouridine(34) synthase MnmH [Bacteroidia bacterium]
MPVEKVDVNTFLALAKNHLVFDVRSPNEYAYAHIPGAISLPIFNDTQRAEIGTAYKQINRQDAIKIGFKYFGGELNNYVNKVEQSLSQHKNISKEKILVHCWRGGMRSGAMAWLLDFYGFEVILLDGGYKSYRNFVLEQLAWPYQFNVLGGYTGSGKTEILLALIKHHNAVIDLEGIACHKGSSFGSLGMSEQPTQEQFENNLANELSKFVLQNEEGNLYQPKPIWIENESQRIGLINLPKPFYQTILNGKLFNLNIPFQERLNFITKYYGTFEKDKLVTAIMRIQKRLGGLDTKNAINFLLEGNVQNSFDILLKYYDKQYLQSANKTHRKATIINSPVVDENINAQLILQQYNQHDN